MTPQKNQRKIFVSQGEELVLGKLNDVYISKDDSLIKINKSFDSRINFGSYNFQISDTIIKFGGYGFWSQRNFLYYFDTSTYEWELYPINYSDDIEGSFVGYTFINEKRVLFLGGEKVSKKNRLQRIPSTEIIEYNVPKREVRKIGELNFNFSDKEYFYKNDSILYLFNDTLLFKINPFDNTINEYKKPPVINYKMSVEYDDNLFKIHQLEDFNQTLTLVNNFNDENSLQSYKLYETEIFGRKNHFIIILLLLVTTLVFLKLKYRKKDKLAKILTKDELTILLKVLSKDMLFNDLLKDNYEKEISYVHNTRQLNSKLKSISLKLKTKYNTIENPIVKTKYPKDKRLIMISLSDEIKKFLNK
jgi:hypothetical protein